MQQLWKSTTIDNACVVSNGINVIRSICDEMLVLSVKSSLFVEDTMLSMRDSNNEYLPILEDYSINNTYSFDHKKHPKYLHKNFITTQVC